MQTRMQYDILQASGNFIATLLAELQNENELFASANTLERVEARLLVPATLMLMIQLRRQEPMWFEIIY